MKKETFHNLLLINDLGSLMCDLNEVNARLKDLKKPLIIRKDLDEFNNDYIELLIEYGDIR